MKTAYIVQGYRTAVGKAPKGVFRFKRPDELAAETIEHLLKDFPQLDKKRIDDVGINLIRFSIKCNTCLDSSEEGTFTATRKPYKSKSYLFDFIEQH